MAINVTDLVAYAAANMPTDESSAVGGAIDPTRRVVFTDLAANDVVQVVSNNAADTMNITVVGRAASGIQVTQTIALTGTTPVTLSSLGTVQRLLSANLASTALGTVTVRRQTGPTTIADIPTGEIGFQRLFINAYSDLVNPKPYYMKFFWKNTNGSSLSLINAVIKKQADGTGGLVTHALATAVNDTGTSTNRLTVPASGVTSFDNSDKNVPGTNLTAGDSIGVWLKLSLGASQSPINSSYTSQAFGLST